MIPDQAMILAFVTDAWRFLRPLGRSGRYVPSASTWIVEHAPVAPDERGGEFSTPIIAAWFANDDGLHERSVQDAEQQLATIADWRGSPYQ